MSRLRYQESHLLDRASPRWGIIICGEAFSIRGRNRGVSLSSASDGVDDSGLSKAPPSESVLYLPHVRALEHHLLGEGNSSRGLEVHLSVATVWRLIALLPKVLLVEGVGLRHVYVEFDSKAVVPRRPEGQVPWVLQNW